ncbi:MAG: hypothetical protein K2H23_07765, partial [Oscillospiraceae bacterium]|nr:hypothetical protein [Oscillospiraceae bacterium]
RDLHPRVRRQRQNCIRDRYTSVIREAYGDYILKFDGKTVSQEILREHDVVKSSIKDYLDDDKYYWQDEEVTEEEYEQLYRKFIWDMEPLTEMNLYVSKRICNQDMEQKDLLAAAVLEYIENQRAVERRVIYNNGTEKLTAERYINALKQCAEFTDISLLYRIQLADVNNDGIPEALALTGEFEDNILDIFFVSASGEVRKISVEKDAAFRWVTPHEKDGKIIWIADIFNDSFSGEAVLHISDNSARLEEICSESYGKKEKECFWHGQSVSYQEYEKLHEDYFGAMDNSAEIYAISAFDYWTRTNVEKLSDVMEEYIQSLPYTYNDIKDTVLYSDEKNSLTVGQYIDAVVKCRDFTDLYKNGIQLSDINGDGIPEAVARIAAFPITSYFSVSAEGEAFMLYDKNGESQIEAELPEPYEKGGKVLWLSEFYVGGSVAGGGGDSILTYEDGVIKKEIIRCYDYSKDLNTFEYYYTYYWGSDGYWDDTQGVEVSEEEYESRYETLLAEMQPVEAGCSVNRVYGGDTFRYYELKELLAEMLKECLEL